MKNKRAKVLSINKQYKHKFLQFKGCIVFLVILIGCSIIYSSVFGQTTYKPKTRQALDTLNGLDMRLPQWQYSPFAVGGDKLNNNSLPIILLRSRMAACNLCLDSAIKCLYRYSKTSGKDIRWVIATDASTARQYNAFKANNKLAKKTIPVQNIPIAYDTANIPYITLIDVDGKARYFYLPQVSDLSSVQPKIKNIIDLYFDQPKIRPKVKR